MELFVAYLGDYLVPRDQGLEIGTGAAVETDKPPLEFSLCGELLNALRANGSTQMSWNISHHFSGVALHPESFCGPPYSVPAIFR